MTAPNDPGADALELRPYSETEVQEAMRRLAAHPMMELVRRSYFPGLESAEIAALGAGVRGWHDFQERFIAPAIDSILAQSSDGFSISGFERIERDRRRVFVSNHRDIVCDPALFTYGLHRKGWDSPMICLGDNLLVNPFIVDLVKMNRGITVKRGLPPRELLRWSHALSRLVNDAVRKDEASVWIAQREGRAKDGNDATHPGVIKMLALGGPGDVLEALDALRFTPVAVSYEYDPCDALKARELHLTETEGEYRKAPGEDVKSMALGIRGYKGRIHIEIGRPIARQDLGEAASLSRKEQLQAIAAEIDRQVRADYRLWPTNFIARDLRQGSQEGLRDGRYTEAERDKFVARLSKQLDSVAPRSEAEREGIRSRLLAMYARALGA
jgi:1-acyl-sn-glycerol-3-phosphate acyltransferase